MSIRRLSSSDRAIVVRKIPLKLSNSDYQVRRLRSGLTCVPIGRKNIGCEQGLHKWGTKIEHSLPKMVCLACGASFYEDMINKTMTRREIITAIQKDMEQGKPRIPLGGKPRDIEKAKEKIIVEAFERHQREWKIDKSTRKEVPVANPDKK
jgi:hypothetical protein